MSPGEVSRSYAGPRDGQSLMAPQHLVEECEAALRRWHEATRAQWERQGFTHDFMQHDAYNVKKLHDRKLWICLDNGPPGNASGTFMVRKADGQVFGIKGYGKPNLRKPYGHVCDLFADNKPIPGIHE